jgi:23S rRNA (pseudouridine1915-N3)-methyltransferase
MRVTIAAVGKLKDDGERDLFDRYAKRFDQTGRAVALGPLAVVQLPESKSNDVAQRKADEASRLLKAVAGADFIVALDEHGKLDSSIGFADRIGKLRDGGTTHIGFVIGGPDGHGQDVLTAARFKFALGPMTLPHGLARIILAEQLYRTVTILSGHPYHRA